MFRRLQKQLHDTELGTGSGTTGTRTCTYVQVQWGYTPSMSIFVSFFTSGVDAKSDFLASGFDFDVTSNFGTVKFCSAFSAVLIMASARIWAFVRRIIFFFVGRGEEKSSLDTAAELLPLERARETSEILPLEIGPDTHELSVEFGKITTEDPELDALKSDSSEISASFGTSLFLMTATDADSDESPEPEVVSTLTR
jgi:hypothetical protein